MVTADHLVAVPVGAHMQGMLLGVFIAEIGDDSGDHALSRRNPWIIRVRVQKGGIEF